MNFDVTNLTPPQAHQLLARRSALKLEVTTGLKFSNRGNIAQICREAYGITHRPKQKVLEEMNKLCDALLEVKK